MGQTVPRVVLRDQDGNDLSLDSYTATYPAVMYFYPGDMGTPSGRDGARLMDGLQHCAFRDTYFVQASTIQYQYGGGPHHPDRQLSK